ncbi:MAG: hypothetical protein V3V96_16420 [Acidiferrobacterales bacterium]
MSDPQDRSMCPFCNGEGLIPDPHRDNRAIRCETCKGDGTLPRWKPSAQSCQHDLHEDCDKELTQANATIATQAGEIESLRNSNSINRSACDDRAAEGFALVRENNRLRESAAVLERFEKWKYVNRAWRVEIVCHANSEEVWFVKLNSPFGIPQPTIETTGHHGLLAALTAALDDHPTRR